MMCTRDAYCSTIGLGFGIVIAITGCLPTPAAPRPLRMHVAADTAAYLRAEAHGTSIITGHAFVTTRGGDVKVGDGSIVTLDPLTP